MSEADRYRLGPIRDQRSRDERLRRGDLASAATTARASQDKLDAATAGAEHARAALDAARSVVRELALAGTTSAALVRAEHYAGRMRRELDRARDVVGRALTAHRGEVGEVDAARGRLARARADKEVIERHFASWRADQRKLAERRED